MTAQYWLGNAPAVAQVTGFSVTAYDATTTYTVTIGNYTVSVLGQGGTTTTTAAALVAALSAATAPQPFQEVTWANVGAAITGTAKTAGVPFTCTTSVSGGTGTIGAASTTTASAGPNDWSTAANWLSNSVPAGGDDVYLDNSTVSIYYGLNQSGVTLNSLTIALTYTGQIGLPKTNSTGSTSYGEYRPDYLEIGATTINIGKDQGLGSPLIKINTGSVQTTLNVYQTGQSTTIGLESLLWKGTNASNAVNVYGGQLGAAVFGGETAAISDLNVSANAQARTAAGVTLTTVENSGGTLEINTGCTTLTQQTGTTTIFGSGAFTTMQVNGGTVNDNSSGTITTLNATSGGRVDLSANNAGKTITHCNLYNGSALNDPNGTGTYTNGITLPDGNQGVTLVLKKNITLGVTYN